MSGAIAFDLTLTAALCHWLLGIRLAGLAYWTTIPVVLMGLALCKLILPAQLTRGGLLPIAALAAIESSALVVVALRIRKLSRSYQEAKHQGADSFDAVETAFQAILPSMPLAAAWLRLEIQLWTLGLIGWAFKRKPSSGPTVFTHHKQSSYFTILGVIGFLILSEGALVHLWLSTTHHAIAKWISLAIHAYCTIWLLGEAQATRIYRSSLQQADGKQILDIRVGLRGHAQIPVENIKQIDTGTWTRANANADEALLTLQGTANVKLTLTKPAQVKQILSSPKTIGALLLQVDDPEAFKQHLAARQSSEKPAS
ncbi:MAG TPA: hypothetical protein VFN67_12600 [Polyangiales bacterium]|nr:hypothetical protein [Polyangiales bacterium]